MILEKIAEYAKQRVQIDQERIDKNEMQKAAFCLEKGSFAFEKAIRKDGISIIAEVKKASPSKGIIAKDFLYKEIAKDYEKNQVDAISVLTEPKWFLGSDEIFCQIRKEVEIPLLRKDFIVDEYQIYQAKTMGANAVLLICAITPLEQLRRYLKICEELGLSALVETHDQEEIENAVAAGARIVGVNNRNLKDFTINMTNAHCLRRYIPSNVLYVAESGISSIEDGISLVDCGADALLIGEYLMRNTNRQEIISQIKGKHSS